MNEAARQHELQQWIRATVAEAPPLTPAQRDKLAVLLRKGQAAARGAERAA